MAFVGLVVVVPPQFASAVPEELFRPAGLDPAWPGCFRANGFGIDSVGCAVNDVPGGRSNADKYVFLHGHAFRSTGEPILNINGISPFGQGETVGWVNFAPSVGLLPIALVGGGDGQISWWGAWVPIEEPDGDAIPPVTVTLSPRVSSVAPFTDRVKRRRIHPRPAIAARTLRSAPATERCCSTI
jgi:hypothetical protein